MRLLVGPSRTEIVEASVRERKFVRELLQAPVPGARFTKAGRKGWDGIRRFVRSGRFFPTGLLYLVERHKPKHTRLHLSFSYDWPTHTKFTPHKFQMEEEWAFQKEVVRRALYHGRGLIWTATNSGKSLVMAALAGSYQCPVLVLIHRREILLQLQKMFRTAIQEPIGVITSNEVNLVNKRVVIGMIRTIYQRVLDEDPAVMSFFQRARVLMADEGHHLQSRTYQFVFEQSTAPIRFGFSGTIPPEKTLAGMLVRAVTGPVLIRVTNMELVESGISATPTVLGLTVSHNDLPAFPKSLKGIKLYNTVERLAIVECRRRHDMIADLFEKHQADGVVAVVNMIQHGKAILETVRGRGLGPIEFVHGTASNRTAALSAFKRGDLKMLIASEVLDEGIDTDQIRVLIMAGGRKSRRQLLQRFGRGMRAKETDNSLRVYELLDYGHKFLAAHTATRQKIWKGEGFALRVIREE